MKFTGEYRISAPRERVWAGINDPAVLQRCVPGCEALEQITPTQLSARVVTRVGPIRATFTGEVRLEDLEPPSGCRIVGAGSGGVAGFAEGSATVRLEADGSDATILRYEAEAQIGGKLAQIGSRLIDSFAKRFADDFFSQFAQIVGGEDGSQIPPALTAHPERPAIGVIPVPTAPVAAAGKLTASLAPVSVAQTTPVRERHGLDSRDFTIVVLSLLLAFMTVMAVIGR